MKRADAGQMDREVVLSLTGGDKAILFEVFTRMRVDNSRDLQALDRALSAERWQEVAHSLHRLAGSVRITGSARLAEQCQEMESIALNAPDITALREEHSFLLANFRLLEGEIDQWLRQEGG